MSRPRWLWSLILVGLLVVAACTSGAKSDGGTTAPSTTSAPTTPVASTPTSTLPSGPPSYLVYGWDGVTRVEGGVATRLTIEPAAWATEDGGGGVVYRTVTEEPGVVWLPAGTDRAVELFVGDRGRFGVELAGLIEGRPSLVVARYIDSDTERCKVGDPVVEEMFVRDLQTGQERFVACRSQSSDAGSTWTSYGGGLFTVERDISLIGHTSGPLQFVDLSGEEVAVEHNPFPESCAPCELDAQLSPDGRLLAYAYWPTSSIAREEPPDGDYTRALDEWWEASKGIPVEFVGVDLETGEERWRTEAPARTRLDGFNGRYLTVGTDTGRTIHDTVTGAVYTVPPAQTEPNAFWVAILDSLDTTTHTYDDAQQVTAQIADEYEVETGVLWSDGWVTLNPGYWAVFTGQYPSKAEAASACEELRPLVGSCYPRYVATAETIHPEIGRGMIELRADGLGLVDFGDPVDEVMAALQRSLGLPTELLEDPDAIREASGGWYREASATSLLAIWSDVGLLAAFSEYPFYRSDGQMHLSGWTSTAPASPSALLTTEEGIGIGATLADVRNIYGNRLVLEDDVCGPWVHLNPPTGDEVRWRIALVFGPQQEAGSTILALHAGASSGC